MPGKKKVPERSSGLHLSEKKPSERRPDVSVTKKISLHIAYTPFSFETGSSVSATFRLNL
jgi:hypothetical protein